MDHPPPKNGFFLRVDAKCECHPDWIGPYIIHSDSTTGRCLDITK